MGRSKSQRVLLEVVIPTRLSRADFAAVQSLAEDAGLTPAHWVRNLILDRLAPNAARKRGKPT